jgi:hypothetical protein
MADLGFEAIGMQIWRQYWPAFFAGAVVEVWLVLSIRRARRFSFNRTVSAVALAVGFAAALWVQAFLATALAYQTLGEQPRVSAWQDLQAQVWRSWPPGLALAAVLLALLRHPRSGVVVATLVVLAGALVSWMTAMWLFVTHHHDLVFRVLVLPGGLGVVAAVMGVLASTALWMAIGRWIWREGRRRPAARMAAG